MTTTKPGYTTTEFWGKLAVQVLAFLTLLGVINPAPGLGDAIVSIIGLAGPEIAYALSRGHVKAAAAATVASGADLAAAMTGAAQAVTGAVAQLTPPAPAAAAGAGAPAAPA